MKYRSLDEEDSQDLSKDFIAVFDLDHTLLIKNSSFCFFFFLLQKGFFPKSFVFLSTYYYIKHRFLSMSLLQLHQKIFQRFLCGKDLKQLEDLANCFWEKYYYKLLRSSVIDRLESAKKNKGYTLILSSSPDFLIKPIAERLKVDAFVGSKYGIDKDHKLCEILLVVNGLFKATYVNSLVRKLQFKNIYAYSDCIRDLPLLEIAHYPVCVAPARKLASICRKQNWELIKK